MTVDTTDVDPEGNETVWNGKKVSMTTEESSFTFASVIGLGGLDDNLFFSAINSNRL